MLWGKLQHYKITNTQPKVMHKIPNYFLIILYNLKLHKIKLYGQKLYNE